MRYGSRADTPQSSSTTTLYASTRSAGFGAEVRRRILLGTYTLSAEAHTSHFVQAQRVRRLVQRDFDRVFRARNPLHDDEVPGSIINHDSAGGVDILLTPTAATTAPLVADVGKFSPVQTYTTDIFTVPASLAGLPAISIPLRLGSAADQKQLDIGMQVIGQFGADDLVLAVASLFEATGLAKSPVKHEGMRAHVLKQWFSDDLARSYSNMRRYYGGGMAAVQWVGSERERLGKEKE